MKRKAWAITAALTTMMVMASTQTAFAQTTETLSIANSQDPDPAEVGTGVQTIYGLEPTLVEPESVVAGSPIEFELPEECSVQPKNQSLRCNGVAYTIAVSAVDGNADLVSTQMKFDGTSVFVTTPQSTENDGPVVVTPFLAASSNQSQLNDAVDAMESMLINDASASIGATAFAAISRPSKITVPSNYIYNPNTKVNKSLHDYCTWSPNSFSTAVKGTGRAYVTLTADFRGPCARHDMCIETVIKRGAMLSNKKTQRRHCDNTFQGRLQQNCSYTFYETRSSSARNLCFSRAALYYSVVSLKTNSWNGK